MKRTVLVLRECHTTKGMGGYKTVKAVAKEETEESVKAFVARPVTAGTVISAVQIG